MVKYPKFNYKKNFVLVCGVPNFFQEEHKSINEREYKQQQKDNQKKLDNQTKIRRTNKKQTNKQLVIYGWVWRALLMEPLAAAEASKVFHMVGKALGNLFSLNEFCSR